MSRGKQLSPRGNKAIETSSNLGSTPFANKSGTPSAGGKQVKQDDHRDSTRERVGKPKSEKVMEAKETPNAVKNSTSRRQGQETARRFWVPEN